MKKSLREKDIKKRKIFTKLFSRFYGGERFDRFLLFCFSNAKNKRDNPEKRFRDNTKNEGEVTDTEKGKKCEGDRIMPHGKQPEQER